MSYLDDREREIAKAHERRMASRSRFIEGNPGAVSPQERASVMQWKNDQGLTGRERALQQHEMDMLKQRGAIDLGVAEQKRLGMREQGSAAAEANGRFGLETEKLRGANALTLAEKEWAGKKEIAEIEAKSRQLGIEAEHGSYDENGNYRPGSRVLSERERGEWSVKQQTEANKGTLAQAEVKRQQQEAQIAATLQRAAIQSQGKIDKAKIDGYSKEISAAIVAHPDRDPTEIFNELRTAHKDDPGFSAALDSLGGSQQQQGGKKEVKRQRNPKTGQVRIVYDDGSTEIVNE